MNTPIGNPLNSSLLPTSENVYDETILAEIVKNLSSNCSPTALGTMWSSYSSAAVIPNPYAYVSNSGVTSTIPNSVIINTNMGNAAPSFDSKYIVLSDTKLKPLLNSLSELMSAIGIEQIDDVIDVYNVTADKLIENLYKNINKICEHANVIVNRNIDLEGKYESLKDAYLNYKLIESIIGTTDESENG